MIESGLKKKISVFAAHPLKQGLKPEFDELTPDSTCGFCCTSTKTRIETKKVPIISEKFLKFLLHIH